MPTSGVQECPVCGVKIASMIGGDRVIFSSGPPGTRAILWTRVCQYAKKPGCINQGQGATSEIKPNDYYKLE